MGGEAAAALRKAAKDAQAALAKLNEQLSALDRAMFDPTTASKELAGLAMSELMKRRAGVAERIEAAEAAWLAASEGLEGVG